MTTKTAIIFPDTNLFLQCHPLENLSWSSWELYDELHLIICRSVQRELDSNKYGTRAQAKRARRALRLVRSILNSETTYIDITSTKPIVKLYLDEPGLPSGALEDNLDYSKPDDELVGYVHRYSQSHPNADLFLLTHDIGPMATAKNLGLNYQEIPDQWLIGSQQSDSETKILRDRIRELERREPQIEFDLVNNQYMRNGTISIDWTVYDALSEATIISHMETLEKLFPMQTEFDLPDPHERAAASLIGSIAGMKQAFVPATEQEIRRYQDEDYPQWLANCESFLSDLHSTVQDQQPLPYFALAASNIGTRPARDVLVVIRAQGDLRIYVDSDLDTDAPNEHIGDPIGFPQPPVAPTGRWSGPFDNLTAAAGVLADFQHGITAPLMGEHSMVDLWATSPISSPRDPNSFYYKPERPMEPTDSFSLVCSQWRHRSDTEFFEGIICFDHDRAEIEGAIICEIHAENLSRPVSTTVPVRIRTSRMGTEATARDLLRRLRIASPGR